MESRCTWSKQTFGSTEKLVWFGSATEPLGSSMIRKHIDFLQSSESWESFQLGLGNVSEPQILYLNNKSTEELVGFGSAREPLVLSMIRKHIDFLKSSEFWESFQLGIGKVSEPQVLYLNSKERIHADDRMLFLVGYCTREHDRRESLRGTTKDNHFLRGSMLG